jgi:small subunit ribosomal protein S16
VGAKKRPSYRVVVADSRAPRDGKFVDLLGYYDPLTTPSTVRIDVERAVRWLHHGAEPTETVRELLRQAGALRVHHEERMAAKLARKAAKAGQADQSSEAAAEA